MNVTKYAQGHVNGIRYKILDKNTIHIYRPLDVDPDHFKQRCKCVVKYLISEAIFASHKCKVMIIQST